MDYRLVLTRTTKRAFIVASFLAFCAGSAGANTISYQQGDGKGVVSDTDDTTITPSTANQGADVTCGVDQAGPHDHCVLKFPNIFGNGANQIPLGSTIVSATLTLYVENDGADDGLSCPQVFQLTQAWTESQATWDNRMTAVPWASPGAETGSHKPVAEGIIPCDPIGFYNLNVTTSVRNWSDGEINEGWVLKDQGPSVDGIDFTSSEGAIAARRPMLTVTYNWSLMRSVGVTATALATGAANAMTIAGSTATFATGLANNIGVGDAIQYDSDGNSSIDAIAFIHGRTNSQTYTVRNKTGGLPTPVAADNDWSLFRAYTRLANWESQTENTNINAAVRDFDTSTDLVTANASMNVACYADGADTTAVTIDGWTTGASNYISIFTPDALSQAGARQRHSGVWDLTKYRLVASRLFDGVLSIRDEFVRVTGLQVENTGDQSQRAAGIYWRPASATAELLVSQNVLRATGAGIGDWWAGAVVQDNTGGTLKAWNNIAYDWGAGVFSEYTLARSDVTLYNNTLVNSDNAGIILNDHASGTYYLANNLVQDLSGFNYYFGGGVGTLTYSATNLSQDGTSPQAALRNKVVTFVGGADYHLSPADTNAQNQGTNLSSGPTLGFSVDIDGGLRQVPWDIGADDTLALTAVDLVSFAASGRDGAVELAWETGSEIDNLGFHLHRALAAEGPYARITASLVPGLGSSPEGARYVYRDADRTNGVTYYYKLEDIETTGGRTFHGPVSATPREAIDAASEEATPARITYGRPESSALRVERVGQRGLVLELVTGGFHAEPRDDGTVELTIPDFGELAENGLPSLPVRRTWVDVDAGRKVKIVSIEEHELQAFTALRPAGAVLAELVATEDGTVRLRRGRGRGAAASQKGELYPAGWARVVSVGFQRDAKRALMELAPLRWDEASGRLLLARRLVVRLSFDGEEPVVGRRDRIRRSNGQRQVVARLATVEGGLYRVRHEDVWPRGRGLDASSLRLSRQGKPVPFHIEPDGKRFGAGSVLYFVSEGAAANPYGREAVYELEIGAAGDRMPALDSAPRPSERPTSFYSRELPLEENRYYQAALLDASDRWFWDVLLAPVVKSYSFTVNALVPVAEPSHLSVWLQGGSDFPGHPDHHVRVSVNGNPLTDATWDGRQPLRIDAELPPGVLVDGVNRLELENVSDTGAPYSMVLLDRFLVRYPRAGTAENNALQGVWSSTGTAALTGFGAGAHVLDVTGDRPRWLTGSALGSDGTLRFHAESSRRYLVVGPDAVRKPEVGRVSPGGLRSAANRADYLLVGPRAFLGAAEPLLELRRGQGLAVAAVAIEDVFADFGFGEANPGAVREFLEYAYHHWGDRAPRYVVLLGDATYDFKDYLETGVENHVPPLMVKTSYLWTASDPGYALVNGEDVLPDLAIGRLPAASAAEARTIVAKILAYEAREPVLDGPSLLIADNADVAGDFPADAEELASGILARRDVRKIYLSQLGTAAATEAIVAAFDEGASTASYLGHGGIHLWASENLFDISRVGSLAPQPGQPIVFTMNCLNGYFHFPYFNSLAEELVKAGGKGAIAAFSPSGLSLNAPAHLYHQALLQALLDANHERLGDAILAAQEAYANTGAFPELLAIYHLFGDPALRLR